MNEQETATCEHCGKKGILKKFNEASSQEHIFFDNRFLMRLCPDCCFDMQLDDDDIPHWELARYRSKKTKNDQ